MKTLGRRSWKVLALSWGVAIVAVLGLLPWQVVAQGEEGSKEAKKPAPAEQRMNVEITSGQFKITLDRVRWEPGRIVALIPTGFPYVGEVGSQQNESEAMPGGQGRTSTTKASSNASGAFAIPNLMNLILDVAVKAPHASKKQQLICIVSGKVQAVDDLGRTADSADLPNTLGLQLTGVGYREGPGRTAIHLYLPPSNSVPRYLQTVDGQLLVAAGTVNRLTFPESELSNSTTKRGGGVSARVEKIRRAPDGIDVTLVVSPPRNAQRNGNRMANPMAQLRQMIHANDPGRVSVALVDSQGNTHPAVERANKSVAPDGTTFYSGGGGGGGGGGGSNGSFSPTKSNPARDYHFEPLPSGVTVKAITCTVTDLGDTPKVVPFHFKSVQLPENRR
jgi:hypothetical protein